MTASNNGGGHDKAHLRRAQSRPAVLGLDTESIGDLSIDELAGNKPALKMLLHKYGEYLDENRRLEKRVESLQTELQIYSAYRDGYGQKLANARTATILNLVGAVLIGFGVNLSTPTLTAGGLVTLVSGVVVSILAMSISLKR